MDAVAFFCNSNRSVTAHAQASVNDNVTLLNPEALSKIYSSARVVPNSQRLSGHPINIGIYGQENEPAARCMMR